MTQAIISGSILAADFARLAEDVNQSLSAGADYIHFDVMDHHFLPNLSFGPLVCRALRKSGITAPIDVHLMVENPEQYIEPFAAAGANLIAFHPETVDDVGAALQTIRDAGCQTGLVFNPDKDVSIAAPFIEALDLLLVMSVNPGFAGQSFMPESLRNVEIARDIIGAAGSSARLGIDGGINVETIGEASKAGADFFVVGSALFAAEDYKQRVEALRRSIVC